MRRLHRATHLAFVTALLSMMLWMTSAAPANAQVYSESAVKAAYLYRFADYIDWPSAVESRLQFIIAVFNDDEVAAELMRLLSTHSIKNVPAQVHKINSISEIGDAQIVYIGAGYNGDLRKIIARIVSRPVLIVTNRIDALDAGSAINFVDADHKVRFEASLIATKQVGLKISPELLSVATRVETDHAVPGNNCAITTLPDNLTARCNPATGAP